jgi:5'-nucleotidase
VWRLRVWTLRPFENEPHVFAATHPCLGPSGPVYDLAAACYTSTHTHKFEVLVTNDDGYAAPGIDAVVEALRQLPNVHVTVSAPATNQSGSSDKTTPGGVSATLQQTASGYPAWAANGFPGDSVLYALDVLRADPDLVVSGSNQGQNIGPFISLSGTVGAARIGGRALIPAVAVSQGFANPTNVQPDYTPGVDALMTWVDGFLFGREGPARLEPVVNINAPTCAAGSIRGTIRIPVATQLNGRPLNPSNCTSTVTTFNDDMDAFLNGYITISSIGT